MAVSLLTHCSALRASCLPVLVQLFLHLGRESHLCEWPPRWLILMLRFAAGSVRTTSSCSSSCSGLGWHLLKSAPCKRRSLSSCATSWAGQIPDVCNLAVFHAVLSAPRGSCILLSVPHAWQVGILVLAAWPFIMLHSLSKGLPALVCHCGANSITACEVSCCIVQNCFW